MLSLLICALTVVAMLLTLLTAGMLGFYTMRLPQGDAAMGLVVPLISAILAGLAGLLALALLALRGGLDPLGWTRTQAVAAALGAGLLLGLAVFGALIAWAEVPWARQPLLLNLIGLLLPLSAHSLLLLVNLRGLAGLQASPWGRSLIALGAAALLAGAACGIAMLHAQWMQSQRHHAAALAQIQKRDAEQARRDALSPQARLREQLAEFSINAPLWTLSGSLSFEADPALRAIWIERALQVPEFDIELRRSLRSEHGIYRHGAAVLIAEMPPDRLKPGLWSPWLAEDARLTAETIRRHGLGAVGDERLAEHALAIAGAAARLQAQEPSLQAALQTLREAVAAAPAQPLQAPALQALQALLS